MNDKVINLFDAPDQVRNSSKSIVNNESATHDNENKKSNSYTCFIPENLDLDSLIKVNPHSIPHFHIDKLVYILGLLIEIPLRNKGVDMLYVPINSRLVQRRVREYREYLNYLIKCGVILEDKQYIPGSKSKGFKYIEKYQTKTRSYTLTKKTLIKSLLEFKNIEYSSYDIDNYYLTAKKSSSEDNKSDFSYLINWFNSKLTIDYEKAEIYLIQLKEDESKDPEIENHNQRYMIRHAALVKFHKGIFLPNEDNTAGRLHSALTQIKGDLRPLIRYDKKKLVAIDIVNSQPYLSTVLLNPTKFKENNILEIILKINPKLNNNIYPIMLVKKIVEVSRDVNTRLFINLVSSGKFYEEFGLILKKNKIIEETTDECNTRKNAKKITFSSFFSPNNAISYRNEVKIFNMIFPKVYSVFKMIKYGKGHHNTLPILLQRFEANLVLHKACKIISENRQEIPILTLHDSIITTEENVNYVYNILKNVLTDAIGLPPELKVERWD